MKYFADGSPKEDYSYNDDGELHGVQKRWSAPDSPTPSTFSYRNDQLHGPKLAVDKRGDVVIDCEYKAGSVVRPTFSSDSKTSEMLAGLVRLSGAEGMLHSCERTGLFSLNIDADQIEELFGEPAQVERYAPAGSMALIAFQGDDGWLVFRQRSNPGKSRSTLDLLTARTADDWLGQTFGRELARTDLYRFVRIGIDDPYSNHASLVSDAISVLTRDTLGE